MGSLDNAPVFCDYLVWKQEGGSFCLHREDFSIIRDNVYSDLNEDEVSEFLQKMNYD